MRVPEAFYVWHGDIGIYVIKDLQCMLPLCEKEDRIGYRPGTGCSCVVLRVRQPIVNYVNGVPWL